MTTTVAPTVTTATCQYQHETWGPNEGCREFMTEPEVWPPCGDPADEIHIVTQSSSGPNWEDPDGRWFASPDIEVSVAVFCATCGELARAGYTDDPYILSVRINTAR